MVTDGPRLAGPRQVAAQHMALVQRVQAVFRDRLPSVPGGRDLVALWPRALVAVLGAHALGQAGPRTPLDLVLIPTGDGAAPPPGAASALDGTDPLLEPAVAWRVRSRQWLVHRLGEPEGLWLWQRAAVVADPVGILGEEVPRALSAFRLRLPTLVAERYGWLREGLEQADVAPDVLGRRILVGRAVEAALQLPLLARGEPFPPPPYLPWYLRQVCPQGEEAAELAGRVAVGPAGDRQAGGVLRRLVDELLEVAGYGESLVRQYRRRA